MSAVVAIGRRHLPRGWSDLGRQLAIWFGFALAYQLARGVADRDPSKAFVNGWHVAVFEEEFSHRLYELTFANFVSNWEWLQAAVSWTYWNSEFTVVGLAVLWVYMRRHDAFTRFRNTILLANVLGLVGYVLLPTFPPRMYPNFGFVDTLAQFGGLNHGSSLIALASNPYAAMPSLHAADSLIVGVVLAMVARRWWSKAFWLAWPAWVWFAVMATGNHFWLDCVAGMGVAVVAMGVVYRRELRTAVAARRR